MAVNQQHLNITQYLPHRKPMLLVDMITEISEKFVETIFTISDDCIFVKGEVFQASGIIENMAQTCSAIVGQTYFENGNSPQKTKVLGFISGIKKVEIFSLPIKGQNLITRAELISRFEGEDYNLCTMDVTTFCGNVILANANINLFLQKA